MGTQLWINGEPTEYEDDLTVHELKQAADFPADDVVVYTHGDATQMTVSDHDAVDHIPDGPASPPSRSVAASPALEYGVHTLTVVDPDTVERSISARTASNATAFA